MDSDAHPSRRVVVSSLSPNGSPSGDCYDFPYLSPPICSCLTPTSSVPGVPWPEAIRSDTQARFSGLIGSLALRAIRSKSSIED